MRISHAAPTLALLVVAAASLSSADPAPKSSERPPWEAAPGQARAPALATAPSLVSFSIPAAYRDCGTSRTEKSSTRDVAGFEPKAAGRYPVFVYLTGTLMKFNGPEAQRLTHEMAKRGFVAAAVDYDNAAYPYCPAMSTKAKCIFDESSKASALGVVCAREKADCSLGVVVAGFSQGANLAALSGNYAGHVRAAYLMGHGDRALNGLDVSRCADDATTNLSPSQMRSVNGEADLFFGGSLPGVRKQLQRVVGVACEDSARCEQPSGSGWLIVGNGELADRAADHCYFLHKANTYCSTYDGFDPTWEKGDAPWAMRANLDWLASQVAVPQGLHHDEPGAQADAPAPTSGGHAR